MMEAAKWRIGTKNSWVVNIVPLDETPDVAALCRINIRTRNVRSRSAIWYMPTVCWKLRIASENAVGRTSSIGESRALMQTSKQPPL